MERSPEQRGRGNSYVSMKQEPFSEVSADSVNVLQKTDLSGAKLSVSKVEALPDPKGKANTFMVTFESGERWRIQRNGFNCTYIIYECNESRRAGKGSDRGEDPEMTIKLAGGMEPRRSFECSR